jgi:metallo-beta-lactamase class B
MAVAAGRRAAWIESEGRRWSGNRWDDAGRPSHPGHTRGCTTWAWQATEGDKKYDVVVIGSPNVNPGYRLVGNRDYPEIADDFATTFMVLKKLPCDIFLGAHGNYYGMHAKYERIKKSDANPFIDPQGYQGYVAEKEKSFQATLEKQEAE